MFTRLFALVFFSIGIASASPLYKRAVQLDITKPIELEPMEPCLPSGGPGHVTPLADRGTEVFARHTCPRPLLPREDTVNENVIFNSTHILRDEQSLGYTDDAWMVRGSPGQEGYNNNEAGDGHVFDPSTIDHLGPGPVVLEDDLQPIDADVDADVDGNAAGRRHICNVEDFDC